MKWVKRIILILIPTFFFVMHFRMDHKVGDLERQFVMTVESACAVSVIGKSAGDFSSTRYEGHLNALVTARDSIAHAGGYRVLGGWVARGSYADTFCIYLYTFGL